LFDDAAALRALFQKDTPIGLELVPAAGAAQAEPCGDIGDGHVTENHAVAPTF
jgi:hypothetical protein